MLPGRRRPIGVVGKLGDDEDEEDVDSQLGCGQGWTGTPLNGIGSYPLILSIAVTKSIAFVLGINAILFSIS
jgi:hypothetical protein